MNIKSLYETLDQCKQTLDTSETNLQEIATNIIQNTEIDEDDKQESYDCLSEQEKIYQKKNEAYKKIISQLSPAYLSMSDFYVGPNLPRDHESTFLDSKKDIEQLYGLCLFFGIASLYGLR